MVSGAPLLRLAMQIGSFLISLFARQRTWVEVELVHSGAYVWFGRQEPRSHPTKSTNTIGHVSKHNMKTVGSKSHGTL